MSGIRLSLVAAVADNDVIGRAGAIPWRLSTDLRRFKRLTLGKPVIMGRKTFESIGASLPGRTNIVVSGRADLGVEGTRIAPDLQTALALAEQQAVEDGVDEMLVIGGERLYRAAIAQADRLYITHVALAPEGEARFPPIDPVAWRAMGREAVPAGEKDSAASTFVVYERVGTPDSG